MNEENKYIIDDSQSYYIEDFPEKYNAQRDFTSLEAWNKSRQLKLFFYKEIIPRLPEVEKYNLNLQIRKAAISITANISEGYGRFHFQEGMQFYRISRGSIYELKDHLITCFELNLISKEIYEKGICLIENTKITLNGYINFVNSQIEKGKK